MLKQCPDYSVAYRDIMIFSQNTCRPHPNGTWWFDMNIDLWFEARWKVVHRKVQSWYFGTEYVWGRRIQKIKHRKTKYKQMPSCHVLFWKGIRLYPNRFCRILSFPRISAANFPCRRMGMVYFTKTKSNNNDEITPCINTHVTAVTFAESLAFWI